jgi:hypothetical protein
MTITHHIFEGDFLEGQRRLLGVMDVPSYKFAYRGVIYWGRRTNYTRIGISISGRVNMPRCHQKHNLQQNIGVNYGIGKNLL